MEVWRPRPRSPPRTNQGRQAQKNLHVWERMCRTHLSNSPHGVFGLRRRLGQRSSVKRREKEEDDDMKEWSPEMGKILELAAGHSRFEVLRQVYSDPTEH